MSENHSGHGIYALQSQHKGYVRVLIFVLFYISLPLHIVMNRFLQ